MTDARSRRPLFELADGAVFRGWLPRASLRSAVELVWTIDGVSSVESDRVLPNGAVELIVNLGGPQRVVHAGGRFTRYRDVWVAGIQRGPLDIASERDSRMLGIRFRPGGAAPVLELPMREVADAVVEWDAGAMRTLRERLLDASTDAERVTIAEDWIEAAFARRGPPDTRIGLALAELAKSGAETSLRRLAASLGCSHKHLITLFHRHVGVPPRRLARILRFQGVIRALDAQGAPRRWTDLAYEHGYADQAHLTREFRELSGVPPTAYAASRTVDPNHLALAALPPGAAPAGEIRSSLAPR